MFKCAETLQEAQQHLDQGGKVVVWYNWGQFDEVDFIDEEYFNDPAVYGIELVGVELEDEGDIMDNILIEAREYELGVLSELRGVSKNFDPEHYDACQADLMEATGRYKTAVWRTTELVKLDLKIKKARVLNAELNDLLGQIKNSQAELDISLKEDWIENV